MGNILGYDEHYSYLLEHGIDCIENLVNNIINTQNNALQNETNKIFVSWTNKETKHLKSIIKQQPTDENLDWPKITKEFNKGTQNQRTKQSIYQKWTRDIKDVQNKKYSLWTTNEKEKLKDLVAIALKSKNGDIKKLNWPQIAKKLKTSRSADSVKARYRILTKTEKPKTRYSTRVPKASPIASPNIIIKIESKSEQQTESDTQSEDDIEIMNGDGWDYKQCENNERCNNVFDIDEDIDLTPKLNGKCPITLQKIRNPYKSKRCGHVFEKDAILNYIDSNRKSLRKRKNAFVNCPVFGCSVKFDQSHLEAMNSNKKRRSSFDINLLPSKKAKLSFIDCLPPLV